ncbi:MAG TPA: DUF6184 family natural product biosynthesis lipoprotein [Polyangiaceae bacterium]|nr:DUF6184 family natural product biosynthesis lipoprotein [Polyangiaceae bacterium]
MKFMSSTFSRWALGGAVAFLGACGGSNTDAADNTPIEPTRETRIKDLAAAACDRYEACSGYGSGQTYSSETECQADFTNKAGTLWPDDKCGSGRINNPRYETCVAAAKDVACGGGILDAIAALSDCNAGQVCTDPPQ